MENVIVGIIAAPNPDYNPAQWWHYSEGVREVVGESIAYVYARLFFYPSRLSADEKKYEPLKDIASSKQ